MELTFEYFSLEELNRLRHVCRTFNDVINNSKSTLLQQRLFLKAAPPGQPWIVCSNGIYPSTATMEQLESHLPVDELPKVIPYEYHPALLSLTFQGNDANWSPKKPSPVRKELSRLWVTLRARKSHYDERSLYATSQARRQLANLTARTRSMFLSQPPITFVHYKLRCVCDLSPYCLGIESPGHPRPEMGSIVKQGGITFGDFADAVLAHMCRVDGSGEACLDSICFTDTPGPFSGGTDILGVRKEEREAVED